MNTQNSWRKSSFSGSNAGTCVEITDLADEVRAVRDSKDPEGPVLRFAAAEWRAFVDGVAAGEL